MKLVVPRTGEPQPSDARLIRLAEFLGIACELVSVEKLLLHVAPSGRGFRAGADCLVVNPCVMKEWTGGLLWEDFASVISRFPHLLIHAFTPDPFCDGLVKALCGSETASVRRVRNSGKSYQI